ncbi:MAG: D-alanyl-D-alanine carboxypeptidase [Caulobacteraceae bacterium]|nr:D-alanyl-D-alanine carboxypeptidase [Caulobacteraceae bacterium]
MFEPARRVASVLAALSLVSSAAPALAEPSAPSMSPPPPLADLRVPSDEPRYAAIVEDARSGEVLYDKRADSPRYPASITKIMTLYLTFEALATGRLSQTDILVVSPHAAAQAPTKLGLRPGDTITVEDAMHAVAVKSANDMAVALAEKIGGSEGRFAALMTLKAQELGMTRTRFVNANGLPDSRQITTARDIATLCRAVLRDYPQYYGFFGQEQFTFRGQTMTNHNGLLGRMPGVDGFKTGFTNAAGFNLAASAVRNGRRLITVVLGGSSGAARNANVEDLLLTGFDVEERRARGEPITLAQNYFEAPPPGGSMPHAVEQGDADPIDVVLTSANRGAPVNILPSSSSPLSPARPVGRFAFGAAPPAAQAQARDARNWTVQVGEFRSDRLATRQVDFIADKFKQLFDDREGQVNHSGGRFRAIFTGFSQAEAKGACAEVQAKGLPCQASGPG